VQHPSRRDNKRHTTRWAETIARYDGFVFVTPEYNHSIPVPTEPGTLTPGPHQDETLTALLDDVVTWSRALRPVREGVLA
jgi:NADPH-dependent FMN reductase